MAIQKKINQNKVANPEALCEIPAPTCHQAGPEPFNHCPCPPKVEPTHLCNSFADAVAVCEQIYLNVGETHTEFYQDTNKTYHCVVAIGNINKDKGHLYLTDSGTDTPISEQISSINAKLGNITINISEIEEALEELDVLVNNHSESIATLNSEISKLSNSLSEILKSIKDLNTTIEEHTTNIQTINSSIANLDSSVVLLSDSINSLDNRVIELEKLEPISDSSIISLFHSPIEDALTVNLCCYTEAGFIKVEDFQDEYKDRVADCTPVNEYKTYNIGEHVKFTAIANDGYKFVKWLEDGSEYSKNQTIELEFNENRGDINVIGTLNDGVSNESLERAPLKNGYTALFEKLLSVKVSMSVTTRNSEAAELSGDEITIKVNGILKEGSSIFVNKGDIIEIQATAIKHHNFVNYRINDVDIEAKDGYYQFIVKSNTEIEGIFEEIQYSIHGEPNIASYGNITIEPHKEYVIEGTTVKLNAVANSGYVFKKWVLDESDPWAEDPDHSDWSDETNPISIIAGDVAKDWDINAIFEAE